MADTWSAAPKTIGSRRTAGWSSPDNRFSSRLTHLRRSAGPHWTIGWCQTPVAGIAGVAYCEKCLRSGSALHARANVAIDRPDALAAHDLGRSVRGLSLLNSGLIPQVPFSQFLF